MSGTLVQTPAARTHLLLTLRRMVHDFRHRHKLSKLSYCQMQATGMCESMRPRHPTDVPTAAKAVLRVARCPALTPAWRPFGSRPLHAVSSGGTSSSSESSSKSAGSTASVQSAYVPPSAWQKRDAPTKNWSFASSQTLKCVAVARCATTTASVTLAITCGVEAAGATGALRSCVAGAACLQLLQHRLQVPQGMSFHKITFVKHCPGETAADIELLP